MVEFRLYYDEIGKVICYTCEDIPGNYVIIDSQTYAECRVDIRVVDGKIIKANTSAAIAKLIPSSIGVKCASIDVNIIVDDEYKGETINWDTKHYEYKYN